MGATEWRGKWTFNLFAFALCKISLSRVLPHPSSVTWLDSNYKQTLTAVTKLKMRREQLSSEPRQ